MKRRHTTEPKGPGPSRADVFLYHLNQAVQDEPDVEELHPCFRAALAMKRRRVVSGE